MHEHAHQAFASCFATAARISGKLRLKTGMTATTVPSSRIVAAIPPAYYDYYDRLRLLVTLALPPLLPPLLPLSLLLHLKSWHVPLSNGVHADGSRLVCL